MKPLVFALILFFIANNLLYSQKDEVNKYLKMVANGQIDQVRAVIPDLLAKYPNDAGVKLLHGSVIEDAFLALEVYKRIVKDNSESEFADDAYWRVIQFYAIIGDTMNGKNELDTFKKKYPNSPFLGPSSDIINSAISVAKLDRKMVNPIKARENHDKPVIKQEPKAVEIDEEAIEKAMTKHPELAHNKDRETAKEPVKDLAKDNNSKDSSKKDVAKKGKFGLQVGIYKDMETAKKEKERFLKKRLRTEITEKKVAGKTMFAVVIGDYETLPNAEEAKKFIGEQCHCDPMVYKK